MGKRRAGFTFVELMISMGVLLLFTAATFAALTQFNRFAAAARLRVHALALAQQRVDEIMTTQWRVGATRPPVLNAGTRDEAGLAMNADEFNTGSGLGSIFTDLIAPVEATRRTEVVNLTARTVRATVTVTFRYANREYQVLLTTLRTTDTI